MVDSAGDLDGIQAKGPVTIVQSAWVISYHSEDTGSSSRLLSQSLHFPLIEIITRHLSDLGNNK